PASHAGVLSSRHEPASTCCLDGCRFCGVSCLIGSNWGRQASNRVGGCTPMLERQSVLHLLLVITLGSITVPSIQAQIHGVPSSVTSIGFGGSHSMTPGVPASVTSLGPRGFGGRGFGGRGFGSPVGFGGSCC